MGDSVGLLGQARLYLSQSGLAYSCLFCRGFLSNFRVTIYLSNITVCSIRDTSVLRDSKLIHQLTYVEIAFSSDLFQIPTYGHDTDTHIRIRSWIYVTFYRMYVSVQTSVAGWIPTSRSCLPLASSRN